MAPRHPSRSCQSPSRTGANATYPFAGGCFIEGRANRPGPMPMLTFWLDQPIWLIFGSLACLVLAWCLMLITLTNTKRTRPFIVGVSTGIAPAFVGVVSVLLSLLIGFVANDAWERQRQASRVVQTESAQARAVYNLSRSVSKDLPEFRNLLADYIKSIVDEEWPAMAKGGKASSRADHAFGKLLQAAVAPNFDVVVGKATIRPCSRRCSTCRPRAAKARPERDGGDDSKWVTLSLSRLSPFWSSPPFMWSVRRLRPLPEHLRLRAGDHPGGDRHARTSVRWPARPRPELVGSSPHARRSRRLRATLRAI